MATVGLVAGCEVRENRRHEQLSSPTPNNGPSSDVARHCDCFCLVYSVPRPISLVHWDWHELVLVVSTLICSSAHARAGGGGAGYRWGAGLASQRNPMVANACSSQRKSTRWRNNFGHSGVVAQSASARHRRTSANYHRLGFAVGGHVDGVCWDWAVATGLDQLVVGSHRPSVSNGGAVRLHNPAHFAAAQRYAKRAVAQSTTGG